MYHADPVITRFGPAKPAGKFAGYRIWVPGLGMPGQNAAETMLKLFRTEVRQRVVERIRARLAGEKSVTGNPWELSE